MSGSTEYGRVDPRELEAFDERTKVCTMNCGPSTGDSRSAKERKYLCPDCWVVASRPMSGEEKAVTEQKPVAWMQSDHLHALMNKHCGAESMLARCSDHQLMPDYKPLYTTPQPTEQEVVKSLERECNALNDKTIEHRRLIENLASMCRRMSYALNRAGGSDTTVRQCIDLLKRHDLGGSIIRTEQVAKPTDSGREKG